ncbi:MAG: RibD family protein [Pedobacter sp.]|nr:MAG: RibD family protein [Pedobacter sp.]
MKIERPYVICLMMTSVDGKILSDKWGNSEKINTLVKNFESAHDELGYKAWIVGRTTMERDFTNFEKPVVLNGHHEINREDFVADRDTDSFAISIDSHAKLGWKESKMQGDHVITILTEGVANGYLAHLREIGVSYIFAGKHQIELPLALTKLKSLFGIETLMLEGGGHINGSFLNEGLIDELHQLLLPIADGTIETSSIFEIPVDAKKDGASIMKLHKVRQIENDVLWLTYKFF